MFLNNFTELENLKKKKKKKKKKEEEEEEEEEAILTEISIHVLDYYTHTHTQISFYFILLNKIKAMEEKE